MVRPKRLSACPPLEIIDRAMPLIFVGPRHVKYGLLILILLILITLLIIFCAIIMHRKPECVLK